MEVQVLAFGVAKEIIGKAATSLSLDSGTIEHLKLSLEKQYPKLKELSSYLIAINDEYTTPDTLIASNDEIAIIPPVSGG